MEIGLTRLARNSIIAYLRDHLFVSRVNVPLTSSDHITYSPSRGPWLASYLYDQQLYGRATGALEVKLYRDGNEVSADLYTVNYVVGAVKFNEKQPSDAAFTATFSHNWADIKDAWPDEELDRPVIAVESGPIDRRPLELGGGRVVTSLIRVHVFAMSVPQRDDMTDAITKVLAGNIPLIDFNQGMIFKEDGSYNSDFDPIGQRLDMMALSLPDVRPNPTGSDEPHERSRTLIQFEAEFKELI